MISLGFLQITDTGSIADFDSGYVPEWGGRQILDLWISSCGFSLADPWAFVQWANEMESTCHIYASGFVSSLRIWVGYWSVDWNTIKHLNQKSFSGLSTFKSFPFWRDKAVILFPVESNFLLPKKFCFLFCHSSEWAQQFPR